VRTVDVDLEDPDLVRDPYPVLSEWRADGRPVQTGA